MAQTPKPQVARPVGTEVIGSDGDVVCRVQGRPFEPGEIAAETTQAEVLLRV